MPINTPNMGLIQPIIGQDTGLTWEESTNANAGTVDVHTHAPGSGVQIPSAGIGINDSLQFNNQSAVGVQAITFTDQGTLTTLRSVYAKGGDLFYNDAAGNAIQITTGGGVNATSSGISSGTATASFVSSVLVVNADTNKPANIQGGSILLGNNVTNSKYLTLSPPNAMAANITETLPAIPAVTSIMQMDNTGTMTAALLVDDSSIQNVANVLAVKAGGVTGSMLALSAYPCTKYSMVTSSGSFVVPANMNWLYVVAVGGGGGGGAGTYNTTVGSGGGGGAGGQVVMTMFPVTSNETLTITIGAGGAGGVYGGVNVNGPTGGFGGSTLIKRGSVTYISAQGGLGGSGALFAGAGTAGGGGVGFANTSLFSLFGANGGTGANSNTAGAGGSASFYALGQSSNGGAGSIISGGGGGGGGGWNQFGLAGGGDGGAASGSSAGNGSSAPGVCYGAGGGGCSGGAATGPNPSPHGGAGAGGCVFFGYVGIP